MAKEKTNKRFKVGVNLRVTEENQMGIRFEAGDGLPDDLTKDEIKALKELDAVED